jgi:hypothetical protein
VAEYTEDEIVNAFRTELAALVWAVGEKIYGDNVHAPATFGIDVVNGIVTGGFPAALVIFNGSQYEDENPEFAKTNVSIVLIERNPGDNKGELSMLDAKGLLKQVRKVRRAIKYFSANHDGCEVVWVSTSAGVPLKRQNDPGGYTALEIKFEVRHLAVDEA